jgi:hypothetical protein
MEWVEYHKWKGEEQEKAMKESRDKARSRSRR